MDKLKNNSRRSSERYIGEICERFNGLVVKRELHIDSDSNSFTEKAYTLRSSRAREMPISRRGEVKGLNGPKSEGKKGSSIVENDTGNTRIHEYREDPFIGVRRGWPVCATRRFSLERKIRPVHLRRNGTGWKSFRWFEGCRPKIDTRQCSMAFYVTWQHTLLLDFIGSIVKPLRKKYGSW